MNANNIINGFAHKHRCSRFNQQRMIEALILELEELKESNKDWKDSPEEPNEYWYIDSYGTAIQAVYHNSEWHELRKQIGNHFETKEEAEKAVEKLKAITRLSKCGLKFEGYDDRDRANGGDIVIYAHIDIPNNNLLEEAQPAMLKDLDLLFGGEE